MIWALLALLGIPIWFIAAVLVVAFRNRSSVRSSPDVFEFVERKGDGWARRPGYARMVSDVVIVHVGLALIRTDARQVIDVEVQYLADPPAKLEPSATELTWTFADSNTKRVAVATADLDLARGPGPSAVDG